MNTRLYAASAALRDKKNEKQRAIETAQRNYRIYIS